MLLVMFFAIVPALTLSAGEQEDSTAYLFRFVPRKDMFYSPWGGNGAELARLLAAIDRNREAIENGQMYLCVTSYGAQGASGERISKTRRNRVKSELIVRGRIKEMNFVTDKNVGEPYGDEYDVVVVMLPASVEKVAEIAGNDAADKVEAYNKAENSGQVVEQAPETDETATTETPVREYQAIQTQQAAARQELPEAEQTDGKPTVYNLALRANLLRWATLTPDLGVEWRVNRNVGIAVNGSWTSWTWKDNERRYALWEVAPEVRWYIGSEKRGYIGAMYKAGEFNYKLSDTGKQGNLMGGGITGGYQLKLNNALSMDFSLGMGCIHADYDKYTVIDGVRVKRGMETRNWWGPVQAGVTLVWTIF